MKGLNKKRQGSYDLAQDTRPVVTVLSVLEREATGDSAVTNTTGSPTSRQVTLQDILDLSPVNDSRDNHLEISDLDFESSRVIVVNTKVGRIKGARKRSLSVSPRLGSRASGAGSSCGSVVDAGVAGKSGAAGAFYTWMQSSLRRRLRKRPKKSGTLPRSQNPSDSTHHKGLPRNAHLPTGEDATPTRHHCPHRNHHQEEHHLRNDTEGEPEVVTLLTQKGASSSSPPSPAHISPPLSPNSSSSDYHSYCNSTPIPSCPPSQTTSPTTPSSSTHTPATLSQDISSTTSHNHTRSSCECGSSPVGRGSPSDTVTYVNHRNGSVTAVSAASVLQALTSGSAGAKTRGGGRSGGGGSRANSSRLSHSVRGRSTSVGRRVALGTSVNTTGGGNKKGKKKGKRNRVLGGAWGLFHCAGAGARSRSCTPERHANFRVRSRSATPERYINVRVNLPPATKGNGGKKAWNPRNMMKGKSKRKNKSSRRRYSDESDEEANKENKYDMWGFIKERLEWSGGKGKPTASERMSRRDTLTCRPRGSVNINRDRGSSATAISTEFCPPSPPDLPAVTRSVSERRYDPHDGRFVAPGGHLPPQDTCTYIQRVPPTTIDVNVSNYGTVLSMHWKKGETLPLSLQKCASGHTSVASSLNSLGSKDSKDSGVSSHSGRSSVHSRNGAWTDHSVRESRTNTLPSRYRNRPLPPIPKPELPPKPPESGITLVKTLKLDKFMKNKWISGVSITKKNDLVVVDLKEAYLIDTDGNLKRTLGSSGKGALKEPIDVTVLANGNVAFSDHADQEVKVFTTKGQFVRRVMDKCLANIAGVATGDKRMYIAGTDKRCVTVHSEEEGFLYSIPSKDIGNGTGTISGYGTMSGSSSSSKELFEHPYSLAVNPLTGDIIVGDDYKQRVVALSPDGRVLWRYSPTGDRHFFPCSIAVDSEGYIFIADLYNEKVYMLDSSGKHLKVLLSRGEGLKGGPGAIAVDSQGHLVVADEERTLKVFKYGDKGFALYRRFSMCPDAK